MEKVDFRVFGLVQADLFGEIPEVYVDIHEIVNKRKPTSITLFIEKLEKAKIRYQVKKLEVADLLLPNDYAVERKTVKDFCHSLFGGKDGRPRLFEQIKALKEAYSNPYLLLEGGLSVRLDPELKSIFIPMSRRLIRPRVWSVIEEQIKINPKQYLGAVRYIEEQGIKVIQSFSEVDGASLLMDLYREAKGLISEEERRTRRYPVVRQKPKLKTLSDKQLFFLSGLPRISVMNARKILERFGSPYNAILKYERWSEEVEGIGRKAVEEVKKVLTSMFKEEGDQK